jgi:hypothetical protein
MRRLPILLLAALLPGCGSSGAGGGKQAIAFAPIDVAAHTEKTGICESFTLGNDSPIYVNRVQMAAGPAWHHSNWFFVPDTQFAGPDGNWSCDSRGFDDLAAGAAGGVLFAQSTQTQNEDQDFPAGAAMTIPAHSKIVGDVHLVNSGDSDVSTAIRLTLTMLAKDAVTIHLKPMSLVYHPLSLPPEQKSRFTGTCDVEADNGSPLDFRVYYVLPHYHTLGRGMHWEIDGKQTGRMTVFDGHGTTGEAWGTKLDPPIDVHGATRLSFSCEYDNTTPDLVEWGNAAGEMCVLLAYTDSPYKWAGGVLGDGAVVGTDPDGTQLQEGPCHVYKF